MSDSALPPPPPPAMSPRAAFLERAAPIIARERGLTAKARVLLQSVSHDMELAAEDFEAAMETLQTGELLTAGSGDPERIRFREFLKGQLAELKAGILSARHEQTLVTFAVAQLGISEELAREDLRAVAADAGLRRVPLEEALRYVEELAAQKIGDEVMVDRSDVLRLYHLARDWGLDPADVDAIVQLRLEENVARGQREKLWNTGVLTGAGLAAVLVVLILAVLGFRRMFSGGSPEPAANNNSGGETRPAAPRSKPPAWWDADLTIAVTQARNDRTDFAAVYDALIAEDASRRGQGYELLIDQAAAAPFDYRTWKPLEPVILGSYILEPDDAAAAQLRMAWMNVPRPAIETVPDNPDGYQAAIRPINTASKAIKDKRLATGRRDALADDLSGLVHAAVDAAASEADLQKHVLGALAIVLLEQLPEAVATRPEVLTRHYAVLSALARDRGNSEDLARIDAALAATAVEHASDSWRTWEAILQRGIESRDSLAVLRIVEALDHVKNRDLKKVLAERLFARVGTSSAGIPSTQYTAALRKALGASAGLDTDDRTRWQRLQSRAATVMESRPADDDLAQLRSAVELAWHTNLAMALALPRPNPGQFDVWLAQGPPWEKKEGETADDDARSADSIPAAVSERLTRDQQDTFDRYVHDLGDWQKLDEARRASYLRGIAQVAPKLADVTPIQGRQIAAYLLGRKGDEEQQAVMENASAIKWRQLRIALADGVERSQLSPDHLRRLVVAFSGQEITDIDRNRAAARQALLRSVAQELGAAKAESISEIDRWAGQLATVYRERARLMGASPTEIENAATISLLLQLCATLLGRTASDRTDRLLESVSALAESDVQRSVLVQRALITRTFDNVAGRKPELRAKGEILVADFERSSSRAKSVVAQLRSGEATLLQLWMLR